MSQSLLTNEEDKFPGNQQGTPVLRQEDIDNFIRSSGLDEATVREVYDNFVDQHPDGKMGKGEFRDMMEMVGHQLASNIKMTILFVCEGSTKQRC